MLYGINTVYLGCCDVQQNFDHYFNLLLNKVSNILTWKNLPETVDENWLMTQLILNGKVCWFNQNGRLYALNGNWGGEPNCYYKPTQFIVANPVLGSKTLTVRNRDGSNSLDLIDGVVMGLTPMDLINDRNSKGGLYSLIYQTAGLLADNISSLNVSQINGRVAQLWTVDNDIEARTVEEIVRDMYEGHPYRVLTQDFINKIGVVPAAQTGQSNTLLNLIETQAHIWQNFFSELGIGYAGNLKRERLNEAEIGLQKGNLDINIGVILKTVGEAVDRINELFGTQIGVELNEEVFYEGSGNATLGQDELGQDELGQDETQDLTIDNTDGGEKKDPVVKTLVKVADDTKNDRKDGDK